MLHIPVLTKEVLQYLDLQPNENVIDGTIGQGGHAIEILKRNGPSGLLLGMDWDLDQIESSRIFTSDFEKRVMLINDSYINIREIVQKENFYPVNGILLDLGMSSWQLEVSNRGFTFLKNELLDMRYNLQNTLTAEQIVNEWSEHKIEEILREYGEEKFSKKIAKEIIEARKKKRIRSTFELTNIIAEAIGFRDKIHPIKYRKAVISPKAKLFNRVNPATRTFQALRIAVNEELDNLKEFLPQAMQVLAPRGRLVIISFHSLEDRIVKNFFKNKPEVRILTKKPVTASQEEILKNPRSRSAKLRAITKI